LEIILDRINLLPKQQFHDMVKSKQFNVGSKITFSRTIHEREIILFAELTGDYSPNHVDEEFMKNSFYGNRIAHGALLVGYMSTASSMIIEKYAVEEHDVTPVSLGYDRIRFIKPVFINDTITITYTVEQYDPVLQRASSNIEITNQLNEIVAVAKHILKWVLNTPK